MTRPHVWIVEGRYGGLWLPIVGTAAFARSDARADARRRREMSPHQSYRVRKYVREP